MRHVLGLDAKYAVEYITSNCVVLVLQLDEMSPIVVEKG
jgi:hypothetical protein